MKRFTGFRLAAASAALAALTGGAFACGSADADLTPGASDAGPQGRDGGPVDPLEGGGGAGDAGTKPPPPSCAKYCDLVQKSCTGDHAQYGSKDDCLAFCAFLPPGDPFEPAKAPSLTCRHYYAGNPALTDPETFCPAAGPFGGGLCGDRCTAFCQVAVPACAPDAGAAPYASPPDCKTACAGFALVDGGEDGGGEGLGGPETGDTLNCRLFHLRKAVLDPEACEDLGVDAGACRW